MEKAVREATMLIDSRHLSILSAIHRNGSFSKAAEALNLSQPALSAAVAGLEHAVGGKVLNRSPKGATLNDLGRKLALHALTIENTVRAAVEGVHRHRTGASDRLMPGGTPIALIKYAVPVISALIAVQRISFEITESTEDELLDLLRAGSIDLFLGTVGTSNPLEDLIEIPLSTVSLSAFVRKAHPLMRQHALQLDSIATWNGPWALPVQGSGFRSHVETVFAATAIMFPMNYIGCHTIAVQKELTIRMDCITILPPEAAALEVENGLLVELPLPVGNITRVIGIKHLKHKAVSPVAQLFIDAARDIAAMQDPPLHMR
jgi:DNA-binding transcriptional LysR family regulator